MCLVKEMPLLTFLPACWLDFVWGGDPTSARQVPMRNRVTHYHGLLISELLYQKETYALILCV